MSDPVFLAHDLSGDHVTLTGPEGRHAVTVKRISAGEHVMLIDGTGAWVTGTVTCTEGKETVRVSVDKRGTARSRRPRVTIVQAIPKSERSVLAVDLATQAGADAIVAWQAQRCVAKWTGARADKQLAKWHNQAVASAKQSRRVTIPEVSGPLSTAQVAEMIAGRRAFVLHESATTSIREVSLDADDIVFIVGPEGGIGEEELAQLGAEAITLGPEVYRTASAAMVALSAVGALSNPDAPDARW